MVAIGAMQALSAAGKTPGQDFALVGSTMLPRQLFAGRRLPLSQRRLER